jgi:hypothetical protein
LQWDDTQDNLKLNLQRNVFGIHAPMRLLMERKLVARVRLRSPLSPPSLRSSLLQSPAVPGMHQSNVHLDILMGRDETIHISDVCLGQSLALSPSLLALIQPSQEWNVLLPSICTQRWRRRCACSYHCPFSLYRTFSRL